MTRAVSPGFRISCTDIAPPILRRALFASPWRDIAHAPHQLTARRSRQMRNSAKYLLATAGIYLLTAGHPAADSIPVQILDPNLQVTTVLNSGITQPIGIVFLGTERLPRAGEGVRTGQARHQRRRSGNAGARSRGELQLGARTAEPGAASELPRDAVRVRPLDREQHRRGHQRQRRTCRCWATASTASSGTARR